MSKLSFLWFLFMALYFLINNACINVSQGDTPILNCESISQIIEKDQHLRSTKLKNPFFDNVDSIMKVNGYDSGLEDISYLNTEERDSIWNLARKQIKPLTDRQKTIKDSLWLVQREIDSLNTLELIAKINTFGIDSLLRIHETCGQNSFSVFLHSPPGLFTAIENIITQNQGKIGDGDIKRIKWHLKGRTIQ